MNEQPGRYNSGGRIDRSTPLGFTFDGKSYTGYSGDTLASALLANGVRLVGRSFKYHRPRGIYTAGIEEPNAFVTLRTGNRHEPNVPATVTELYDGLTAVSQNRWPSLDFDVLGLNGFFSNVLSAGFYYKTFMGPTRKAWLFYEHFIRKATGMGAAPMEPDPDVYEKAHAFCDVLIVGAGPAGLMAALAAARGGARIVLAEDDFCFGGSLLARRDDMSDEWLRTVVDELTSMSNVRLMNRTTVFGAYDGMTFGLVERVEEHRAVPRSWQPRQRYWLLQARQTIIAAGMIERPLVFGNNDLPGVMLASAARTYRNRYAVVPGNNVVALTNNNSIYDCVFDLAATGLNASVIDVRQDISKRLLECAADAGITVHLGKTVITANGKKSVTSVDVVDVDTAGSGPSAPSMRLPCDALLVSGGWTPTLHLISQRGHRPVYDDQRATIVADTVPAGFHLAGGAAGVFALDRCLSDAVAKANTAIEACGFTAVPVSEFSALELPEESNDIDIEALWEIPGPSNGSAIKKFVDLQNDVKADDIRLAHQEGYDSVELLKRYTTLGMSPDQGKTSNLNGLAILAERHNKPINEVGTTTFRPPYRSIPIGVLAGRSTGLHFKPTRRSPMHALHEKNGAVFTQTGLWLRPWYFPRTGEDRGSASVREAQGVRNSVGLVDVSSLGKIDLQGPDATEFLNRVYVNHWDSLKVGKARYGVMLRHDGIAMDDGTTSRLSDDHYFMTTTTGAAGKVITHLEFLLQIAWPDLRVHVTSVTSQWAAMAIAGPRSRDLLQGLVDDVDFDNESFPFMGVAHGNIANIPVRLLRISFSGELAYEAYTPAGYGETIWQRIQEAGKAHDLVLYGTEALGILRIEKGHVAGPEIDGRTTLVDLGLGRMASTKKPFVGRTLSRREGLADAGRPGFVGIESTDGEPLRAGAILCEPGKHSGHGIGFISSVTYSPALQKHIGLGFVSGGVERAGDRIDAVFPLKDDVKSVQVTSPHFYDPQGHKLNG